MFEKTHHSLLRGVGRQRSSDHALGAALAALVVDLVTSFVARTCLCLYKLWFCARSKDRPFQPRREILAAGNTAVAESFGFSKGNASIAARTSGKSFPMAESRSAAAATGSPPA